MKLYILFFLLNVTTQKLSSQEFRFYVNGSNIEESTYANIQDGDLLRVVFLNKKTDYKFLILHVSIILTPIQLTNDNNEILIADTTEFAILNPSQAYASSPTFTLDLIKELGILKYNNCNISFKVKQLLSDTPKGSEWIAKNIYFKEVSLKREATGGDQMRVNSGNR
ncbi:MAG: hypothetical protein H0V14_12560 [Chitinophagaceae bacterium]|nr:hypothetical protein [Chitinophagaceae bacterium]